MERAALTRWAALDYLRGLMALAVMIFHYDKWTTGFWNAATLPGKLGVYAVSVFFVLSGMALTATYRDTLYLETRPLAQYAIRRIARIFPLLWLATLTTLLIDEQHRPASVIFLNLSGLFGFVDPAADIATGAWSVGCELVFYAFFPLMIALNRRGDIFATAVFLVCVTFLGIALCRPPFSGTPVPQSQWWSSYVQIWNHACFFSAGVLFAWHRKMLFARGGGFWIAVLVMAALLFVMFPVGNDAFALVSAPGRVVLGLLTLAGTAGWCFGMEGLNGRLVGVMAWLGSVSYSLYLLHPLVYRVMKAVLLKIQGPPEWLLPLAITGALTASHLTYRYFEKPFMQLGARLANR